MSEDTPAPETPAAEKKARKKRTLLGWTLIVLAVVLGLLTALFLVGRYGVLSDSGRELVSTFVNGKKLGRYGRINVYGLKGDLWDDFFLERVTVTDGKGVWLEANDVRVDWSWWRLVFRDFHADSVTARRLRLIRRPELEPDLEPPKPMPLSVRIERIFTEVELLEGFSKEYGRWAVTGETDINRNGRKAGKVRAVSLSRKGDYLSADAVLAPLKAPRVKLIAYERRGGPIAGALGYSPDAPFVAAVRSGGQADNGSFAAVIRSGAFTPLNASGGWTKDRARAQGYVAFAGSELMKPLAQRFGDSAVFGLGGRKSTGDRFGLGFIVRADNLSLDARGLVNRKTWKTAGPVDVELAVASVSRLANRDLGDALTFKGHVTGDLDAWRVSGDAAVANVQAVGVTIKRVWGDVALSNGRGRFDIAADLKGQGADGGNIIGRLLGASVDGRLKLARLRDGRWLFERVLINGAGGRIEGSGMRTLTGGLAFRGKADLTNLRLLRPGAGGTATATFEAAQARPGERWSLRFDARARRFASGMGQLDRLLGPEPRLRGEGSMGEGRTAIDTATLEGKAGRLNAKGLIEDGDRLRLALDWSARGPFQAGPVEILGDATGKGALTGTFKEPKLDLTARFDQIDLGRLQLTAANVTLSFNRAQKAFDGRIAVTSGSNYGPAEGRSAFRFLGDGVRLDDLYVNAAGLNASGSLALQGTRPSSADLVFRLGPGAFVETGFAGGRIRITDGPRDAAALIDVIGQNIRLKGSGYEFRALRLSGEGTLARLPFIVSTDIRGQPPIKFEGQGVYSRSRDTHTVTLDGQGRLRRADFRTLSPVTVTFGPSSRTAKVDLGFARGRLLGSATQTQAGFDARADLTGVDLDAIGEEFDGSINGVLILTGRGERLTGSFDATVQDARSLDGPRGMDVDGSIKARLTDDRLLVEATAFDDGGLRAETRLDLPAEASAAPLRLAVARTRPMSGTFSIQGEVKPVWDLLLGGDQSLAGQVNASGNLGGTMNAPLIRGSASVASGSFNDAGSGLQLRNLTLDAVFDREAAVVRTFTATDGRDGATPGTVTGQGRFELRRGGTSTFNVTLDRFEIIDNDLATARASGSARIERAAEGGLKVTGDLLINRAEIAPNPPTPSGVVNLDVVEINRPIRDDGDDIIRAPRPRGPGVKLDVKLRAPGNIILEGRGLNVEFALNAQVGGTSSAPTLTGRARVVRGDYEFAGKRFTFERGSVTLSTRPEDIELDLRAVRDDPALTAVIRITGTAAKPVLALTSSPVLPQDEILAQILFGRSASQLSGPEAAQLASSVASLAGGGGLDVIGNIRELAGLDRLAFGSDEYGMTVAGGKYINDNIYFEIIGGGREGQAVQVEWRVRRNLAVVSRVGGQGDAKLSVRWRRARR